MSLFIAAAMAAAIRQAKRARKPKRIYAVEPDKEPVAKTNKPKTTKKHLGFAADKADVRKGSSKSVSAVSSFFSSFFLLPSILAFFFSPASTFGPLAFNVWRSGNRAWKEFVCF